MNVWNLIETLYKDQTLEKEELVFLLEHRDEETASCLGELARKEAQKIYGNKVFPRGLIEFTNYCKNNCYYCGIRSGNTHVHRYRLTKEEILSCCETGYELGFRTFVLQGGEDPYYTTARLSDVVHTIRTTYPDCAITLSTGEATKEEYQQLFDAGANRFLLRHETYNTEHYQKLHPAQLSAAHRQQCLWDLKEIGYQVGTGFMVGSPWQTSEHLAEDLLFLKELNPQMVGIGPFIPHHDTPFAGQKAGTLELTLFLLGLIRLMLPGVLLPATTALGTIAENGRELGILSGANVVMPNLSPKRVRGDYLLYDNKISTDAEAAECRRELEQHMQSIGYQVVTARGDSLNITP